MTFISAFQAIDKLLGLVKKADSGDVNVVNFLEDDNLRHVLYARGSIISLLKPFIIEPPIYISRTLKGSKEIDRILKFHVDLFSSVYLQAFNVLINIYDLDARTVVDLLATTGANHGFSFMSGESKMDTGQDTMDEYLSAVNNGGFIYAGDNIYDTIVPSNGIIITDDTTTTPNNTKTKNSKSNTGDLNGGDNKHPSRPASSMASSKSDDKDKVFMVRNMSIKITNKSSNCGNGSNCFKEIEIPITVSASITYVDIQEIENALSLRADSKGIFERTHSLLAGSISGINDWLFASDMVREHREKRLVDHNHVIKKMEERERSSAARLVSSGALGFVMYYQILILSEQERPIIESAMLGKFRSDKVKDAFLKKTNSFSITFVDYDFNSITLYIGQQDGHVALGFGAIKNKSDKDNIEDMVKILSAGRGY